MTVKAVNNNEPKRVSALKAAAIGGLTGYALKYALPLSKSERDELYQAHLQGIDEKVKVAKLQEIEAIRNSQTKTLATDVFVGLVDKKEVNAPKIKSFKQPLATHIMELVTQVNDKGRAVKAYEKASVDAITKKIRPAKAFVALGAGISLVGAFAYNIANKNSKK